MNQAKGKPNAEIFYGSVADGGMCKASASQIKKETGARGGRRTFTNLTKDVYLALASRRNPYYNPFEYL